MKYFASVVVLVAITILALSIAGEGPDSDAASPAPEETRSSTPSNVAVEDSVEVPAGDPELDAPSHADRSPLPRPPAEGGGLGYLLPVTTIVRERGEDHAIPNLAFYLEVTWVNGREVAEAYRFSFDGRTNKEGVAHVPFPRSLITKICKDGPEQLVGWITEPGYQERMRIIRRRHSWDEAQLEGLKLDLSCSPGSTLRGTVVNSSGEPVEARLTVASQRDGVLESIGSDVTSRGSYPSALPRGEFALHLTETEGSCSLRASCEDLGATVLHGLSLDPSVNREPLRIVIGEGHRIVGTLVGHGGEPLAGAWLTAYESRLEYDPNNVFFKEPSEQLEVEFAREGRTSDRATTDEQGRFEFIGLQDSSFHIYLQGESGTVATLTAEPVWTNGTPLVLRTEEPMLWISLIDEEGEPFLESVRGFYDFRFGEAPHPWPEKLELRVSARQPAEGGTPSSRPVSLRSAGGGRWRTAVEPGVEYEIGVFGPGRPWTSTRLTIPAEGGAHTRELVVPEAVPSGTVVLSVVNPEGSALEDGFRVLAVDPEGGLPLAEWETTDIDTWPAELSLPAGQYLLRVEGVHEYDGHHGTVWRLRTLGSFEARVQVPAAAPVSVEATLGSGGRVRVRTSGSPPPERSREGLMPWEIRDLEKGPTVELQLLREGAWPLPLEFVRMGMEGTSGEGNHVYYSVYLGKEATSELTPPGQYLLVGRLDDGRTARKPIEVTEGEVTDVELHFE